MPPAERDDVVETTVWVEVGCGGLRAVDGWKAAMIKNVLRRQLKLRTSHHEHHKWLDLDCGLLEHGMLEQKQAANLRANAFR